MATTPGTEGSSKLAFWDTPLIPVVELHDGRQMLKSEFFNHGGSEKFGHGRPIKYHYDRRECALPDCKQAELIVDSHGYSFCPICHTIYNDGKPPGRVKTADQITKAVDVKNQSVKTNRRRGYKALLKS